MLLMMKRAGCECVQFGVESGSRGVLRELGKNITPEQVKSAALAARKAGINLSVYLITGVPNETEEDLTATLRLIGEIKPGDGQISPLAYYPGTALFEKGVASGAVKEDIFETERSPALFVRDDPFVAGSTTILLAKLARVAEKDRFTVEEFRTQKSVLGYCHATNVLAGEFHENTGRWRLAEAEYREIAEQQPDNPWGWLMLGELYARMQIIDKAKSAFAELLRLVPKHALAYAHLGELYRITADNAEAERMYMQALRLDPENATAKKGVAAIRRRK
jgi:tetratricopeptide (TPR) repeat protein